MSEEVDGIAWRQRWTLGVHRRGDADVGVAEEFLDDDEVDALCHKGGSLDRATVAPDGDVAAVLPVGDRCHALPGLSVVMILWGPQAVGGQDGMGMRWN